MLNLTGTLLRDDGVAELLPKVSTSLPKLRTLLLTATRLTAESKESFEKFLSTDFPVGRPLMVDLKLQDIKRVGKGKTNP